MAKALVVLLLLAAAGCSTVARGPAGASPCDAGEASYECQIERYLNVGAM